MCIRDSVERLQALVSASLADGRTLFGVLFLVLERTEVVKDSLGHEAGDLLLREVACRLRNNVRPDDLVARLDGEEFAILLHSLNDVEHGHRLALRLREEVARPLAIKGSELHPSASIGLTLSDLGYRSAEELLRDARLARHEAKAQDRGVALFDGSMLERVAEKLALESDLRQAIAGGQLTLHYQPIYALQPHRLSGFEALLRWTHPQRGPVNPAKMAALAEESDLIHALTRWVVTEAVRQVAEWSRTLPGAQVLTINVNASARDLGTEELPAVVATALAQHGLDPRRLTVEVTETGLMTQLQTHLQPSMRTLHALRESGVRIGIDDFGAGQTALAHLSTLPFDTLKIDRAFVTDMHQASAFAVLRSVVMLGQALERKVVAEGIETPAQLQALAALGVSHGQGYLMSRPLPADQVPALLARVAALATADAAV